MEYFTTLPREIFYIAPTSAFLVMMLVLLLLPRPRGKEWHGFRVSLPYVKLAFGIMTVLNIVECLTPQSPAVTYGVTLLAIAFYQALSFTAYFHRLLNPQAQLHVYWWYLAAVSCSVVVMALLCYFAPAPIYQAAFWIYAVLYAGVGLSFVWSCRKAYLESVARLADYYDEEMGHRMLWLRRLMWMVFVVGVVALITSLWIELDAVFVIFYTIAYAYFLVCIIHYVMSADFIVKAVTNNEEKGSEASVPSSPESDANEQRLAAALQRWEEAKEFARSDIAVEEIARNLGTTYAALSAYFQHHEHTTFREWRTNLRIEEAKRLLKEEKHLTVAEVMDMCGFNDRSNFYRYFQRATGFSPVKYREQFS